MQASTNQHRAPIDVTIAHIEPGDLFQTGRSLTAIGPMYLVFCASDADRENPQQNVSALWFSSGRLQFMQHPFYFYAHELLQKP